MKKKDKKKKKAQVHALYIDKEFICKKSPMSASIIRTRILSDGSAEIRLSDCNNSIRWLNNMNNQYEVEEMLEKIDTTIAHLQKYRTEVKAKDKRII